MSQAELHNYYGNVTAARIAASNPDSAEVFRQVEMEEKHLGQIVYKQVLKSHHELKEEPANLAVSAFRKMHDISNKFFLFEHRHCDPEFYLRVDQLLK